MPRGRSLPQILHGMIVCFSSGMNIDSFLVRIFLHHPFGCVKVPDVQAQNFNGFRWPASDNSDPDKSVPRPNILIGRALAEWRVVSQLPQKRLSRQVVRYWLGAAQIVDSANRRCIVQITRELADTWHPEKRKRLYPCG